jgi:hypothetical protein
VEGQERIPIATSSGAGSAESNQLELPIGELERGAVWLEQLHRELERAQLEGAAAGARARAAAAEIPGGYSSRLVWRAVVAWTVHEWVSARRGAG